MILCVHSHFSKLYSPEQDDSSFVRLHADLFVTLPAWCWFVLACAGDGFFFLVVVVWLTADSLIFVFNMISVYSLHKEPRPSFPVPLYCAWLFMVFNGQCP